MLWDQRIRVGMSGKAGFVDTLPNPRKVSSLAERIVVGRDSVGFL